ncbi:MAG: HAMP domain-containing sensor histidine kinase [Clostridia bacterium]|nr:HAMP domain-containing sensor histidine kinase [Clostridia bacterium]
MDTKLKKFSRSKLTKTFAFFLALLFFTLFVLSATSLFFGSCKDIEEAAITASYLTQGKNYAISGKYFEETLIEYIKAAMNSKLIFKNGSKEDFENYQKAYLSKNKETLDEAVKETLKELRAESGGDDFSTLAAYLSQGSIKLKKIADHKCYLESGVEMHYSVCSDGRISSNVFNSQYGNESFESYEDYFNSKFDSDYYDEYDDDESETTAPSVEVTNEDGVVVTTTMIKTPDQIENGHSTSSIPQSVKNKAGEPNNVIEICSAFYDDGDESFDGYYEITVDKNSLTPEENTRFSFYSDKIKNEAEFKEKARFYENSAKSVRHVSIAVFDSKTGKPVLSTFKDLSGDFTLNEVKTSSAENCKAFFVFNGPERSIDYVDFPENVTPSFKRTFASIIEPFLSTVISDFRSEYDFAVGIDDYYEYKGNIDSEEPFETALYKTQQLEKTVKAKLTETIVFFVLFLVLTVYLVIVAGRKPEDEEVHMAPADGIFTLLRTCINLGAIAGIVTGAVFCYMDAVDRLLEKYHSVTGANSSVAMWHYVIIVLCSVSACAFLLDWILYLARHIKNRSFFKNFLLGRIIVSVKRKVKSRPKKEKIYKDVLNDVLKKIALFVLLPNIVIGLPCLISVIGYNPSIGGIFFGILLVIYDICALGYAVYYAYNVRKLFGALAEIRNGNYNVQIYMTRMPGSIRNAATDIMHLGEGLSIAVDSAVKEEKMKAELITNVSHDLKTPLTSIINYTDLLSRCEITDETAQSYIAVLKEKSERLKKLIEDLVEASKASSGAINVELIKMSLNELAMQIEGEYEDEFEAKGLELIVEEGSEELFVLADGKLSHRVLDNLMSNVKKYAMPHTRVYMTLQKEPNGASVTIRNISEGRLNISPEELKARFVRGDSSRTSEGNGLGLSIADNLAALQGGTLDIEIIGDLFSAKVTFRSAE